MLCRNGPVCLALTVATTFLAGCWPAPAAAQPSPAGAEALARMSLEQLSNLEVTSVAKTPQPLSEAPAAVYVITHEAIVSSGATSLADALRLAPNLTVTQVSASDYVVSARGFSGAPQAQNFSNKMLILIDGRSVYSPLYSGVYLDADAVLPRDIDRIEVISGPGAALWGANAVNGIINIITRSARATTGTYASVGAGNLNEQLEARYGTDIGGSAAVRVYARADRRGAMQLAGGASAHDDWYKTQAGFRADWSRSADTLLVEGDAYRALENQPTPEPGICGSPAPTCSAAGGTASSARRCNCRPTSIRASGASLSAASASCCGPTTSRCSRISRSGAPGNSSGARASASTATVSPTVCRCPSSRGGAP